MKSRQSGNRQSHVSIAEPLLVGLQFLLRAHHYAVDTDSDVWDFAVEIAHLRSLGLTNSEFRWFVRKGYVEHAREVTVRCDNGREFRPTGDLAFGRRTCFVLTEAGVLKARSVVDHQAESTLDVNRQGQKNAQTVPSHIPHWDAQTRKLFVDGTLVKRFKWHAVNQENVLSAFEEEGWPIRIDDPLPPHPEQDSKRRLSDTIKCLNRKQTTRLIRFHGDGTGEGVVWEPVAIDVFSGSQMSHSAR